VKEAGLIDGHNVAIEFRWAEGPDVPVDVEKGGAALLTLSR
jgi:hypothetical protein